VGTLATLRLITGFTEVSTFALNLTLVLGLGLGIDYGLFIITRFREATRDGASTAEAIAISVASAGRTVLFSGITVAVSLAAMLIFPFPFLRSFGYAGIAVVGFGVLGATVMLPALLAVVGRWIGPARTRRDAQKGFWHRTAMLVMKRPGLTGGGVLILLLALGSPFLDLRPGLPDDRVLPAGTSSREVQEVIRSQFAAEEMDAVLVVAPTLGNPVERLDDVSRYAAELSRVPGVAQVDSLAGRHVAGETLLGPDAAEARFASADGTWLSIVPYSERLESDPQGLVTDIRAVAAPFDVLVGGYPADLADFRVMMIDHLPIVLVFVFGATLVILFLMTGSVLLPLKATVLNLLSLSVMFGALVFVFQQGNFSDLLGFTPTGTLEISIPILMFCVTYGLSMDYEVFMLARIKEEYDRTGDNTQAVAYGLQYSAPLISAAAIILALSFLVYLGSGIVFLKMLGLGTALAILVDATLIRAVLVPASMRLAGNINWWAPPTLQRLHSRIGLRDG
jgi:putative drug exporter of the RND superfamily